jgi:hypothetical protein
MKEYGISDASVDRQEADLFENALAHGPQLKAAAPSK